MKPQIKSIHHIAIIAQHYEKTKIFYTDILGFTVIQENYREQRRSYKCDLALNGNYQIELFSFPEVAERASNPEAAGLRHLAFAVTDIYEWHQWLLNNKVQTEDVRIDEFTGKKFFFFRDPSGQPLEMYEG